METRTDAAARDKVIELLKDARIAMMATHGDDGRMHARPMWTNTAEFDGFLWFLTDMSSPKVAEIHRNSEVLLTYSDEDKQNYVSISGTAEALKDEAKARELWHESARVWFPKGPDDPALGLIKVTVQTAEYWDSPSSTMLYAYGYLKAVTTGQRPSGGENATVDFQGRTS
jgi:general stress protein 26